MNSPQSWPPRPHRSRPPSSAGDTGGWSGWAVPMYTPERSGKPPEQPEEPEEPEAPAYRPMPAAGQQDIWREPHEPDPDTFSGLWIWITDDQVQLVRRRTIARSARRFSLALLLFALTALAAVTVLSERVITDVAVLDRLALAAFCIATGTPVVLLVAHLRWWWNARLARRLDQALLGRTPQQRDRARRRRALERALVALGWLALVTSGRATVPLLHRVSRSDLADLLFRYGAWMWLVVAAVALVALSVWVVRLVTTDLGSGDTGTWDPLETTLYGQQLRRARWNGRVAWTLTLVGVAAAHVVSLGLWTPGRLALLAVLAAPAGCALFGTWSGWRYDRQERHAAESMPRHSQS